MGSSHLNQFRGVAETEQVFHTGFQGAALQFLVRAYMKILLLCLSGLVQPWKYQRRRTQMCHASLFFSFKARDLQPTNRAKVTGN